VCWIVSDSLQPWLAFLNTLALSQGIGRLDRAAILFALDSDISFGSTASATVAAERLKGIAEFARTLEGHVSGGPSWVHLNLLESSDGRCIVTLAFGAKVGNPHPSVNVSVDKDTRVVVKS